MATQQGVIPNHRGRADQARSRPTTSTHTSRPAHSSHDQERAPLQQCTKRSKPASSSGKSRSAVSTAEKQPGGPPRGREFDRSATEARRIAVGAATEVGCCATNRCAAIPCWRDPFGHFVLWWRRCWRGRPRFARRTMSPSTRLSLRLRISRASSKPAISRHTLLSAEADLFPPAVQIDPDLADGHIASCCSPTHGLLLASGTSTRSLAHPSSLPSSPATAARLAWEVILGYNGVINSRLMSWTADKPLGFLSKPDLHRHPARPRLGGPSASSDHVSLEKTTGSLWRPAAPRRTPAAAFSHHVRCDARHDRRQPARVHFRVGDYITPTLVGGPRHHDRNVVQSLFRQGQQLADGGAVPSSPWLSSPSGLPFLWRVGRRPTRGQKRDRTVGAAALRSPRSHAIGS